MVPGVTGDAHIQISFCSHSNFRALEITITNSAMHFYNVSKNINVPFRIQLSVPIDTGHSMGGERLRKICSPHWHSKGALHTWYSKIKWQPHRLHIIYVSCKTAWHLTCHTAVNQRWRWTECRLNVWEIIIIGMVVYILLMCSQFAHKIFIDWTNKPAMTYAVPLMMRSDARIYEENNKGAPNCTHQRFFIFPKLINKNVCFNIIFIDCK